MLFQNYSEIIGKFRMKTHLFSKSSYSNNSLCSKLYVPTVYSISSLFRFQQLLDPIKKYYISELNIQNNRKFKYEFFPRQNIPKTPFYYVLLTQGILHTEFGLI